MDIFFNGTLLAYGQYYREFILFRGSFIFNDKWSDFAGLSKKILNKTVYKKKNKKVLIPYIIWNLIGICWVYILFPEKYGVDSLSVKHIINMLLNGNGIRYFWFFIPLFMIYFSIPFISEIRSDRRIKLFSGYIFLFLIMNGTLPLLDSLFNLGLYFEKWRVPVISGYLVYPLAGYVIYRVEFSKRQKAIILSVGLLALVVMTTGTYYESLRINEIRFARQK